MPARLGPPLALLILAAPVAAGLLGTILPAFGYLPSLGGAALTLDAFRALAEAPGLGRSAMLSFTCGLITTSVSLAIVFLFVAGSAGSRSFGRIQHLVSPLLSVPHAAAAFGLAFLIAPSGFLMRLVSPWPSGFSAPPDWLVIGDPHGLTMMAGLIIKEIPFLFLVTLAALSHMRLAQTRMLAASLGYGRIAGFLHCAWPPLYRQIRLPVIAVIAFASSAVDVALILGPGAPPPLSVRIAGWLQDPDLALRFQASAGALLQLGVTAAAVLAWLAAEWLGRMIVLLLRGSGRRFSHDRWLAQTGAVLIGLSAFAVFAGLGVLAIWSVAGLWQFPRLLPETFTLSAWQEAARQAVGPAATTLAAGLTASVLAFLIVLACLVREQQAGPARGLGMLIYLPLAVPQIAFLFGLQTLFASLGLAAGFAALVLVHMVFVLPYVFLSLSDPWRAFDKRYEQAALSFGRSRAQVLWRIRLPMLLRPALAALAVGFAVSAGLYLPTLLIGAGRLPTITTESVALASGGSRRTIGVYAFLQMALPAVGFLIATALPAFVYRHRRAMRA